LPRDHGRNQKASGALKAIGALTFDNFIISYVLMAIDRTNWIIPFFQLRFRYSHVKTSTKL